MRVSFPQFVRLGSEQGFFYRNPLVAWFFRTIGPLGVHARIRNARVLNALMRFELDSKRILDLGSGHGYALFWLAPRYPDSIFEGIELDGSQVEECKQVAESLQLENLSFRQGTYEDLKQPDTYDVIFSIDVLEHVEDDMGMLQRMAEVLKPGGRLVIHVPLRHQIQQRIFPTFAGHTVEDHVRDEYLPEEIQAKIEAASCQVESLEFGFGFWGELAFELNNLFWQNRVLRNVTALLTLPVSLVAGYVDSTRHLKRGNSILVIARKPDIL